LSIERNFFLKVIKKKQGLLSESFLIFWSFVSPFKSLFLELFNLNLLLNPMKLSILSVALIGGLLACQTPSSNESQANEPSSTTNEEAPTQVSEKVNWKSIASEEAILATALMAAPAESRDSCKVMGYNKKGELITLREGSNQFIVLADDPNKAGFSAACYHKSLEPFMARGRALKAEGKGHEEIFEIREQEVKSGKLKMGNHGATLHIYYGPEERYDPETNEVEGAQYRYVVYLPFATAESTGLPIQPVSSNHPWIMNPGTHRAHIMISPLANK
jgi:hypothetical protein